jgi:ribosomal protein L29
MKAKDLKQLSKGELLTQVAELRGKIRDLRFTVTTRQHSKVRDLMHAKKDLARVLTILKQMESQEAKQPTNIES